MADFLLLMHDTGLDAGDGTVLPAMWDAYLERLQSAGVMRGGSRIAGGACFRKSGEVPAIAEHLGGYIKIEVADLEAAKQWLAGNPVYERGGIVEIRDLPRDE